MAKPPTPAMLKALKAASQRERLTVCPIPGVHAAAEVAMLKAMLERGLIQYPADRGGHVPVISQAGLDAAEFL